MDSSAKFRRILPFFLLLVLFSLSASWGADDPPSQGKGTSTVTFYVA
jgi:hypothetical protein